MPRPGNDPPPTPEPPEPGDDPKRVYRCCGEVFETRKAYERHVELEHSGEPPGEKAYA